ncbi:hypothetical protein [Candidatus Liberibacter sp.]|uniref:F0F1 ATP synthase subunit B family protein n=1 Tax=Candidatus Liberibacter sp. TaxID=34022 RepID=UPI0015F513BF|nr:hypothetical protein [Candidatus Liberibacter sp.]MBA5724487.1 hypothetical protein [Candidatus Liberibacter sp.]
MDNVNTGSVAVHGIASKFPPFDTTTFVSQFFWLVITFGFFYAVMHRLVLPRIGAAIKNRQDRISGDLDEAASIRKQVDSMIESYERDLENARVKARQIFNKAYEDAKKKLDSERKTAEIDALRKLSESHEKMESMKEKALGDISSVAKDIVQDIVQKLIGISISEKDLRFVIESLKKQGIIDV